MESGRAKARTSFCREWKQEGWAIGWMRSGRGQGRTSIGREWVWTESGMAGKRKEVTTEVGG